jgi:hypothetical protein
MADDLVGAAKKVGSLLSGQSAVKAVGKAIAPTPAAAAPARGPATPSLAQLATTGAAVGPTVVNTPTGNLTKMPFPR